MANIKLSDLPHTSALDGSEIIPMAQGHAHIKISLNDLKTKIREDISKEMAAEQAKELPTAATMALGASALVAKSPPVTRRFLRIFGK